MLRTVEVVPRSRLLRAFWTIVWFFPIAFFSRIAVGGIVGGMASARAGDAAGGGGKGIEIGARAAEDFFAEYGVVVLPCQVGVVLALGLRGVLPGTGRERLVASGSTLDDPATVAPPAPAWTPTMQPETGFPVRRSATGGLSLWAVIAATLTSFGVGLTAGLLLAFWQIWTLIQGGLAPEQIADAMQGWLISEQLLYASLATGVVSTAFGGYVAARIGKAAPITNAFAFGLLGLLFGVLLSGNYPAWYNTIGYATVLPLSLFGGWLGKPARVPA